VNKEGRRRAIRRGGGGGERERERQAKPSDHYDERA